jgi:hypothetical protein
MKANGVTRTAPPIVELFNLADDPFEEHNLAGTHPDKLKALRSRHHALAAQAIAPKIKPRAADFQTPKVWGERD